MTVGLGFLIDERLLFPLLGGFILATVWGWRSRRKG